MTQANVKLITDAIDAFNGGDVEGAMRALAPGFELDMTRAAGPFHGRYDGDAFAGFLADFAESWETVHLEVHEFIEDGDRTVVPLTLRARGRGGIEVEARPTFVWTVRDAMIERLEMYQEREDALGALGIAPEV